MKSDLDASYQRYRTGLSAVDIPLQEDLHKYMCIRLSGYLEQLMFEAICGYVSSASGGAAKNFALSFFNRSPNLTPKALEDLVGRFGDPWKSELVSFLDTDERRNSLGSLLLVRNKVAHGQGYRGGQLNVATYKKLVDDIHSWVVSRML
ncbi:HEPN domain-containing protein [Streptomyces sp. NRRL S-241]|uniref:HEPN domain-containing protein n=1 Tax=Streptomyces sp. NRRL S-241 TaxID=1463896 RepID=UPI00131AF6D1|nr:HEPN domain-containing protein [Streptomyces sp. NRRL S-241]